MPLPFPVRLLTGISTIQRFPFAKLQSSDLGGAYQGFSAYEKVLPGNSITVFFKEFSQEGTGNKEEAAKEYHRYLQIVKEGKFAQYLRPHGGVGIL